MQVGRARKERMKIDKRTTRKPDYHGSKNPNAKLTEEDVRLIRKAYADGVRPTALAKKFEVSRFNISNIVARRIWRKV